LLDQENNGKALQQVTDRRTGKVRKENNQELQQRLFQYQAGKFELDPFRLVQLSDAHWQKGDELPSTQVHLAVNRKKAPVIDTNGQLRKAMGDHLYQILECTSPWRYRAFAGQLNLQDVNNLRQQQSLPDRALRFSIKTIARACHHFYEKAFINEINEIKGMGERGYLNKAWGKTVLEIFAIAKEKFQNGEAFLLRVGRHSGAESVTITGVRDIKIMEGKDPSTGNKRFSHAPTAKTLWLAADTQNQQTDLIPFGWLLVEIHPLDAPAPDWLELQGLCEPHLNFARQFAAKRREQAEILVKARLEAETKRRAEEEAERHRAEQKAQAAREEAERKAKLDAMSPAMQAVERFRELYLEQKQKGRYQPGGSFDQQRRTMITEALQWQDQEARRALSVLLRDSIKNWTEWPNKKERKAELKGWLEQLETPRD
jgi:CRISPR-associated protein Csm5